MPRSMEVLLVIAPFVVLWMAVIYRFLRRPERARQAYLTRGGHRFTAAIILLSSPWA